MSAASSLAGVLGSVLTGPPSFGVAEWQALFLHFLMISLLAIGGAMSTAPEMHRFVVEQRHWITDADFSASIALAQAAPGPNVLFVVVIGFNVGGLAGAAAAAIGTLLPSSALTLTATRWGERHRETRGVRAFTSGLAPITLGLLFATSLVLFEPAWRASAPGRAAALALLATGVLLTLRTRLSPLWSIGVGAVAGALGWID